jgi:hypothetical protein
VYRIVIEFPSCRKLCSVHTLNNVCRWFQTKHYSFYVMDKRKCFVFDAVSFSGLTDHYCVDISKFLMLICFGTAFGILTYILVFFPQQYLIRFFILIFIPSILFSVYKLPTNALILISLLFHSVTPVCFGTCVPSSGSSPVPAELQADLGLWLITF